MTFEEFEKASPSKLREEAKLSFDGAGQNPSWGGAPTFLLQAQFYLAEIDRRQAEIERQHDRRMTGRSHRMERIITGLIGLEILIAIFGIWLGFREAKEQATATNTQTIALREVQRYSMAMTETLSMLVSTSQKTNEALQAQLGLTSRVALDLTFDGWTILGLTNTGRTAISVYGYKVDGLPTEMESRVVLLPPAIATQMQILTLNTYIQKIPAERSTISVPLDIYIASADGAQYVVKCKFIGERQKGMGNLKIVNQTVSVVKQPWRKGFL